MALNFSPEMRKNCEDYLRKLAKNKFPVNIMLIETRFDRSGTPTKCVKFLNVLGDTVYDYSLEFACVCEFPYYKNHTVGIYGDQSIEEAVMDRLKKLSLENVEIVRVIL